VRKAYKLYQLGGVVSEILYSPAAYGLDMSAKNMPKPRARISPQVMGRTRLAWVAGWVRKVVCRSGSQTCCGFDALTVQSSE